MAGVVQDRSAANLLQPKVSTAIVAALARQVPGSDAASGTCVAFTCIVLVSRLQNVDSFLWDHQTLRQYDERDRKAD